MLIAGVVADANVLLSAVVGKAALRVFADSNIAVHSLALARALHLPLWSNDKDLGTHGVVAYPTARLLKLLFQGHVY